MRLNRTAQPSVFQPDEVVHPRGTQLERASSWLDEHPELLDMVGACVAGSPCCGRRGLTCETILRCAVLMRIGRESDPRSAFKTTPLPGFCSYSYHRPRVESMHW